MAEGEGNTLDGKFWQSEEVEGRPQGHRGRMINWERMEDCSREV